MLIISQAVQEIKSTLHFAVATGVTRTIYFHPLFMLRNSSSFFEGLCFEVVRRQQPQRRPDILAMGGRCALLLFSSRIALTDPVGMTSLSIGSARYGHGQKACAP